LLGLETFVRLLFYAACVVGIVYGIFYRKWIIGGIFLLVWLLRYIVQAIVINLAAKELGGERRYYLSLPVFDLLQPLQSFRFKLCRLFRNKRDFMRR
jgi:hypothetical protein